MYINNINSGTNFTSLKIATENMNAVQKNMARKFRNAIHKNQNIVDELETCGYGRHDIIVTSKGENKILISFENNGRLLRNRKRTVHVDISKDFFYSGLKHFFVRKCNIINGIYAKDFDFHEIRKLINTVK
ncbi:MAG: hypothetical protein LBJ74_01785 [Heliobacteriaceae bacterium]|jgi:hypothetical protein|nr:hypothetical protein [Heliobacteriaceae bacterium]